MLCSGWEGLICVSPAVLQNLQASLVLGIVLGTVLLQRFERQRRLANRMQVSAEVRALGKRFYNLTPQRAEIALLPRIRA